MVPAVGAMLALAAALAAACFVKTYGVTFLGRPRGAAAEAAQEVDRFSLAAMSILAVLCLLGGIPARTGDRRACAGRHRDSRQPHAGPGRSTLAFDRADCGGPQLLQRTAGDGVHHGNCARWRSTSSIASPPARCGGGRRGDAASPMQRRPRSIRASALPSRSAACSARCCSTPAITSRCRRLATSGRHGCGSNCTTWSGAESMRRLRMPSASLSTRLNRLQFLTIRQYLSLVFATLVTLLLVLAIWS